MIAAQKSPSADDLLDRKQVAEMIRMSVRTVDRWRVEKVLPPPITIKKKRWIRWRRGDIQKWMDDGCPGADACE